MKIERRHFLKTIGAFLVAPMTVAVGKPELPQVVDIDWFRAHSLKPDGAIFAECRLRSDGGEWMKMVITQIVEEDDRTRFILFGDAENGVELQIAGKWRKPEDDCYDIPHRHLFKPSTSGVFGGFMSGKLPITISDNKRGSR